MVGSSRMRRLLILVDAPVFLLSKVRAVTVMPESSVTFSARVISIELFCPRSRKILSGPEGSRLTWEAMTR